MDFKALELEVSALQPPKLSSSSLLSHLNKLSRETVTAGGGGN